MYIKEIKFTNFNDEEITQKFYFNLNRSDIQKWNLEKNGGFVGCLERIENTRDGVELANFIEDLLSKTYGVKSDDGSRFIKKRPDGSSLYEEFKETNAYDVLFVELTTNEKAAAEFINGVLPKELLKEIKKAESEGKITPVSLPSNSN